MTLRRRYRAAGRDDAALPPDNALTSGGWNPRYIDLARDAEDWAALGAPERDFLLRLTALCRAGDEGATLSRLPKLLMEPDEERLEEELSLTSVMWEEARHVEIFRRFFAEVAPGSAREGGHRSIAYCKLVHDALPASLVRMRTEGTAEAQAEALAAYDLIVLGVLAETGYRAFAAWLDRTGGLPGMRSAVDHLTRDASRHVSEGVERMRALVAAHGDRIREVVERRARELLGPALDVVDEAFTAHARSRFDANAFTAHAALRLDHRLKQIGAE